MRYARKCSATNEGMNSGYLIEDTLMYFKYESDLVDFLRSMGFEGSRNKVLNDAFDNGWYMYTEWEDESDFQYVEVDGNLIEVEH